MTDEEKKMLFDLVSYIDDVSAKMRNLHMANIRMIEKLGLADDYYIYFFENVVKSSCEKQKEKYQAESEGN